MFLDTLPPQNSASAQNWAYLNPYFRHILDLLNAKLRSVDFLRFSEVLSSRPVSPHFFNSDVTNSNFRPDIRQVVPLNFQQSFSTVVWKAEFSAVNFSQLIGKTAAGLLKMVDTPILTLLCVTRAILLPLKFTSASGSPQKWGNCSEMLSFKGWQISTLLLRCRARNLALSWESIQPTSGTTNLAWSTNPILAPIQPYSQVHLLCYIPSSTLQFYLALTKKVSKS